MNPVVKIILIAIAALVALNIALMILKVAVLLVFKIAIPVLILGGIAYVAYNYFNGKALMGGRRTLP